MRQTGMLLPLLDDPTIAAEFLAGISGQVASVNSLCLVLLAIKFDKLLGKPGSCLDRHSYAAGDLLSHLSQARARLASKRCSWDECIALVRWIMGGVLHCAPLVGVPAPASLQQQDAALKRCLGVRSTAERLSLNACQLAAVGWGPDSLDRRSGLVTNAMFFLAGCGLYLTVSTDRAVGRILDNLRPPSPQSLVGVFNPAPQRPVSAVWDCLQTLSPQAWQAVLPDCCPISAAAAALLQDGADWSSACRLFCQQLPNPNLAEKWLDGSWEDPACPHMDPRSAYLLRPVRRPNGDCCLFGDGSYIPHDGATFSSQARGFGASADGLRHG